MKAEQGWQDVSGERWAKLQARTDAQLGPLGRAALALVAPRPGERALDVGCGTAESTLELCALVGPQGSVVGVDISPPMLERARERAKESGHTNVEFVLGNAAIQRFEQPFDLVFSRFGVMFFDDSVAAFAHLREALRPGGRLGFVCWQALERNPWADVPLSALRALRPEQGAPAMLEPGEPGPFYFADPDFVRSVLERAGFSSIHVVPHEQEVLLGGSRTLAEALDYSLQIGPAARFIADADEAARPALEGALARALGSLTSERGVVVPARTWLVTAERA